MLWLLAPMMGIASNVDNQDTVLPAAARTRIGIHQLFNPIELTQDRLQSVVFVSIMLRSKKLVRTQKL
jgi:hypothetical protein